MTNKRIQQVADFLYSSDDSSDVPLRLSISMGEFSGADLSKERCIDLLKILSNSRNLRKDLALFLDSLEI